MNIYISLEFIYPAMLLLIAICKFEIVVDLVHQIDQEILEHHMNVQLVLLFKC